MDNHKNRKHELLQEKNNAFSQTSWLQPESRPVRLARYLNVPFPLQPTVVSKPLVSENTNQLHRLGWLCEKVHYTPEKYHDRLENPPFSIRNASFMVDFPVSHVRFSGRRVLEAPTQISGEANFHGDEPLDPYIQVVNLPTNWSHCWWWLGSPDNLAFFSSLQFVFFLS